MNGINSEFCFWTLIMFLHPRSCNWILASKNICLSGYLTADESLYLKWWALLFLNFFSFSPNSFYENIQIKENSLSFSALIFDYHPSLFFHFSSNEKITKRFSDRKVVREMKWENKRKLFVQFFVTFFCFLYNQVVLLCFLLCELKKNLLNLFWRFINDWFL